MSAVGQHEEFPHLGGMALVVAILVLAMSNFMSVLDMTIVNVAIPHIAGSLAISTTEGTWAITSYAVAEAIMVPLTGWLAARFGAVRVFTIAALGFGLFSFLCGLSTSLPFLVMCRVMQGVMGGPLMPMSQTLLLRVAPPKHRNLALGLWTMTTILAPVAGPLVSGVFSDTIGWPWAFYINVPIAITCATLAWRLLTKFDGVRVRDPMDYVGLSLLVVWVGALQIMLDNGEDLDWFGSSFIVILAIVALLGFLSFVIWELTAEHPIVDLRVFRHRGFAVCAAAMLLTFGSFMGSIVLIPLWLQTNMGYTATSFRRNHGVQWPVRSRHGAVRGDAYQPRSIRGLSCRPDLDRRLPITLYRSDVQHRHDVLATGAAAIGAGNWHAAFFVPMMSLAMGSVTQAETASASGLINFLRTMSGAFATAVITFAWHDSATGSQVDLRAS